VRSTAVDAGRWCSRRCRRSLQPESGGATCVDSHCFKQRRRRRFMLPQTTSAAATSGAARCEQWRVMLHRRCYHGRHNGAATMGQRSCYHVSTALLPWVHGDATSVMLPWSTRRRCYHGCTALLPWVHGDATTAMLPWSTRRRCYHGSTALLPWVHGDATMDAWRCYHGPTALLPWVAVDAATGPRRS
jgi:hypothetical protein